MCIRIPAETGVTDMSIIAFDPARALLHRLAVADPAELPVLQREACALLRLVPPTPEPERGDLTDRERDVLETLGWRVPLSSTRLAVDLFVTQRAVQYHLTNLARKGYVARRGKHAGGGWVRIDDPPEAVVRMAA